MAGSWFFQNSTKRVNINEELVIEHRYLVLTLP